MNLENTDSELQMDGQRPGRNWLLSTIGVSLLPAVVLFGRQLVSSGSIDSAAAPAFVLASVGTFVVGGILFPIVAAFLFFDIFTAEDSVVPLFAHGGIFAIVMLTLDFAGRIKLRSSPFVVAGVTAGLWGAIISLNWAVIHALGRV
ncbi:MULTISPECIES: hypothetical protein [unclassified Mesorhizobium]|uniref:hypothetical protein n=1 Tax=unclassified Mesorhizobium TaxID=325217 RepID=UPI00301444B1